MAFAELQTKQSVVIGLKNQKKITIDLPKKVNKKNIVELFKLVATGVEEAYGQK